MLYWLSQMVKLRLTTGFSLRREALLIKGNIYTFDEDAFIDGCEKAVERYRENPINTAGIALQNDFSYAKNR